MTEFSDQQGLSQKNLIRDKRKLSSQAYDPKRKHVSYLFQHNQSQSTQSTCYKYALIKLAMTNWNSISGCPLQIPDPGKFKSYVTQRNRTMQVTSQKRRKQVGALGNP